MGSFFRSPVLRLLNGDASTLETAIEKSVSLSFETDIEDEPWEGTDTLVCGPLIEDVPCSEMVAGEGKGVGVARMLEVWTPVETAELNVFEATVVLVGHLLA